ncbi:hypothetical protein JL721_10377 [Aureococcus anophagefferens]|nr:hypothetical protein JL721_10377 [Aureococcus anophagefferens]
MAALLLLGLLAAPALALRGAESPWAWNIAVIYKRNNPFSVAAKDAVKANLCARFAISPCEVTPNGKPGDIYLAADLDVHVPHKYFSDVIAPSELAVYAGFPTSKNTNRFPAAGVAAARAAPAVAAPETHNTTCGNACDAADSGCAHTCDYLVHTMNLSCAENYAPGQKWTQDHGTSSFDFSTFSLFVVREDLADVLQYVLSNKPADVDFLVHPNTGCSYADHATKYTVANRFGTADEGGWEDETTAPPNDGDSAGWAAANIRARVQRVPGERHRGYAG